MTPPIQIDRRLEAPGRLVEAAFLERLQAQLVLEERQDRLRLRLVGRAGDLREALPRDVGLLPLVLVFLQLLQVDERGLVVRIELQDVRERRDGAVDESAAAVVEAEAEQHVRVLEPVQPRPLQQRLMLLNRAADLALLAIQVAEHEPQLERAGIEPRRLLQFLDREIDLAGDEVVQAEDEVRRLPARAGDRSSGPRRACSAPTPCRRRGRRAGRRSTPTRTSVVLHA